MESSKTDQGTSQISMRKLRKIVYRKNKIPFKYPKILHLYWDGSPLSYLNFITVLSFNKYHKNWKIIIYTPNIKTDTISWETTEQKIKYNGRCYFKELHNIENVTFQKVDLDEIGFFNSASEVIKSDYFRYYILYRYGGLWSDFDIIFTASIEEKMNFIEDSVIFRCKMQEIYYYYPIGLLLSMPNTSLYKYILEQCKINYDSNRYQSIGATMWGLLFPRVEDLHKCDSSVKICNEDYYLPWAWNQLDEFLVKKGNTLPVNNVGIHWFNGAEQSKQYAINLDNRLDNFNIECYLDNFVDEYLNRKISIVMAYYNRKFQTIRTLDGFQKMYANKYDFEVIIVDDNSREEERLYDILKNYTFYINYIVISREEKGDNINPCVVYNKGFSQCKGDIIVIQNPECSHVGDLLSTVKNMDENDYLTFSCYTANSFEITDELLNSNIIQKINEQDFHDRNLKMLGIVWYNHPIYSPTGFHFCSSIYKSKLELIGGFDNRFAKGYCFDDDELLLTIKYNLKLNVIIVPPDNTFVIHQFHKKGESFKIDLQDDSNIIKQKWTNNKKLFDSMLENHRNSDFVYPKLLHLYWDGSKLSFLNYLTVSSFNKYHKEWKIIIYMPKNRNCEISWSSHEQKLKYNETCYFYKLKQVPNVIIKYICLDKIGFRNDASEVIKSDYFRYYILQKHGGVWGDFDIIFTSSIEKKMNFTEDSVIFRCADLKYNYEYYPIGFFISKPNSKFFKYLMEEAKKNYSPNDYQSIGATMLWKLFPTTDKIFEKNLGTIKICNHEYYLPWAWNELDEFLTKNENVLPENNIGIHWFNGAPKSKQYAIDLDKRLCNFKEICFLDKFVSNYIFDKSISIVMAYRNKKTQLKETIKSINETSYDKNKIEIVIVDHCSDESEKINNFLNELYILTDIKIKLIELNDKNFCNPCYAYNKGFEESCGDIIIIQNSEVSYVGDCIKYIVENLQENDWISFNCFGMEKFEDNDKIKFMNNLEKFNYVNYKIEQKKETLKKNFGIIDKSGLIGGNSYIKNDVSGWLNHYEIHFVGYHYCSAINRRDLFGKMNGGFCDDYKYGICFDDNDFINYLIHNKFNFKINKFNDFSPFVIHQFHEKTIDIDSNKTKELWNINQKIFFERCDKINFPKEIDIAIRDPNFIPKPIII